MTAKSEAIVLASEILYRLSVYAGLALCLPKWACLAYIFLQVKEFYLGKQFFTKEPGWHITQCCAYVAPLVCLEISYYIPT